MTGLSVSAAERRKKIWKQVRVRILSHSGALLRNRYSINSRALDVDVKPELLSHSVAPLRNEGKLWSINKPVTSPVFPSADCQLDNVFQA